jgi:hypothetical protein
MLPPNSPKSEADQLEGVLKKVEFLLEQNYLKDELLIQLDEKIEKIQSKDTNQFEVTNNKVLLSGP